MTLTTRVPFDGMTYADLFAFADLARSAGVDPETPVETYSDPDSVSSDGFEVGYRAANLGVLRHKDDGFRPVLLSPTEAQELAGVLETAIHWLTSGEAPNAGTWVDDANPWVDRLMRDSAPPGVYEQGHGDGAYRYRIPRAAFERVRDDLGGR